MPSNIEVKMKVPSLEAIRLKAIYLGARHEAILVQRDTFYRCMSGRLKLREIEGARAELISYARTDEAAVRTSNYAIFRTNDPETLHETLSRSLGVAGVVAKRRTLLLWRNLRIHLDQVQNLGDYIEFESVVGEVDEAAAKANLDELLQRLDLGNAEIVPVAYVDLILGSQGAAGA